MRFQCDRCTGKSDSSEKVATKESTQVQQDIELERVHKFCYLGDMIGAEGGAGDAVRARVKGAWAAFRELYPILTVSGTPLRMKGRLYSACVRSKMVYGGETWLSGGQQKTERAENAMV